MSKLETLKEMMAIDDNANPNITIMFDETICECDPGYLCEHRRDFIIDYIQNNFIERI